MKLSTKTLWPVSTLLLILPVISHAAELANPLGETNINIIIGNVIRAILGFSGVIALLMFVWGGFLWMTSAGNQDRIKKGKDTLIWATIGLVVLFSAYALVGALLEALILAG